MKRAKLSSVVLALGLATIATVLTGCGGSGGGGATSTAGTGASFNTSGGTNVGTNNNKITVSSGRLGSGSIIEASATTTMRGVTPVSMKWSITPMFVAPSGSTAPAIADSQCTSATFSAPPFTTSQGTGYCKIAIAASDTTASGVWRLTNVASSPTGESISDSIDITVELRAPATAGGFRLIESSIPLVANVGSSTSMTVPFTVAEGATVSDVQYTWTASAENPSKIVIAGATNSAATVTPTAAGQYLFTVNASAMVNGKRETSTAGVVLLVSAQIGQDSLLITQPQITQPGALISLNVVVGSPVAGAVYSYKWDQLGINEGGGPMTLALLSSTNSSVTFRAPAILGTYVFEATMTRTLGSGAVTTTKARTAVIVEDAAKPVFVLNVGAAKTATAGTSVTLTGAVSAQGTASNVVYEYQWTQVGSFPASVIISSAQSAAASFIPTVNGTYTFNLRVIAKAGGASTVVDGNTQVVVTGDTSGPKQFALTANAGPVKTSAQNVVVNLVGDKVAQGDTTGAIYTYLWSQVGSTPAPVNVSNATTTSASIFPTASGTYTFSFSVFGTLPDGTSKSASSITQLVVGDVGGSGGAFTVAAGNAQAVDRGTAAIMDGSVTKQGTFDNATYSYSWVQVGVSPAVVTVSNAGSLSASFVPTVAGTYTFMLTVTATQGGVQTVKTAQTQVLAK